MGKSFTKKVPASAVAPAYKLSLPLDVVNRFLSHLVNRDFELSASATSQQCWQGQIMPRRNKDRNEYTLKGWKLFAEAHNVQPGDHLAFELVTPTRLVIQVIAHKHATLVQISPHNSIGELQASFSGSAGGHSGSLLNLPAADGSGSLSQHTGSPHGWASQELEPWSPLSPGAQQQQPAPLLPTHARTEILPSSTGLSLQQLDSLHGGPPTSTLADVPMKGLDAACDMDAWTDLQVVPQTHSGISDKTANPFMPTCQAIPGEWRPGMPPNTPPGSAACQPACTLSLGDVPMPTAALVPITSAESLQAIPAMTQTDSQVSEFDTFVRQLQVDVKRFERRAERAEREEVELRQFLITMRNDLNRCLLASSGLERTMHQLSHTSPGHPPLAAPDQVVACKLECLQHIQARSLCE